ncbi:hypothetical protein [Streptomyces sp. NPDC056154]|uniref:hypothetical protein n=1 Tax=unclassified Streptomyces TaxID=2593676 RepID=UPI0035DB02EE
MTPEQWAQAREILIRHHELLDSMERVEDRMRAEGRSDEDIARVMIAMRNEAKGITRAGMSPGAVKTLQARSMAKYGNPLPHGTGTFAALYADDAALWFPFGERRWDGEEVTVRHVQRPDGIRVVTVDHPPGPKWQTQLPPPDTGPYDPACDWPTPWRTISFSGRTSNCPTHIAGPFCAITIGEASPSCSAVTGRACRDQRARAGPESVRAIMVGVASF